MERLIQALEPYMIETPVCGIMYVLPDGRILDCGAFGDRVGFWRWLAEREGMDDGSLSHKERLALYYSIGRTLRRQGWIEVDAKNNEVMPYRSAAQAQMETMRRICGYFTLLKDYEADRKVTCCFTGPRPKNYPDEEDFEARIAARLNEEIGRAIERGYRRFMTGMALGVDTVVAKLVLAYRAKFPEKKITLEAVLPFEEQPSRWSQENKQLYLDILRDCDEVVCMGKRAAVSSYRRRDAYMARNASLVIAVNSESNGTKAMIEFSKREGCEIVYVTV